MNITTGISQELIDKCRKDVNWNPFWDIVLKRYKIQKSVDETHEQIQSILENTDWSKLENVEFDSRINDGFIGNCLCHTKEQCPLHSKMFG